MFAKFKKFLASPAGKVVSHAVVAALGAAAQQLHAPYVSDAVAALLTVLGAN